MKVQYRSALPEKHGAVDYTNSICSANENCGVHTFQQTTLHYS